MRTTGYATVLRDADVTVLVACERDVPLDGLLMMSRVAGTPVRLDPALCGAPVDAGPDDEGPGGVPLHLKDLPEDAFGQPGIVVAHSRRDALTWMAVHWSPRGAGPVDRTVRSLRRRHAQASEIVAALERLLTSRDGSDDDDERPTRSRAYPMPSVLRGSVLGRREFDRDHDEVPGTRGRFHVRMLERTPFGPSGQGAAVVVLDRVDRVSGRDVPRWDLMWLPVGGHDHLGGIVRTFRDGRWTAVPRSRLDPRDRERFEADGRLVRFVAGDLTQGAVLQPRFLLRVPDALADGDVGKADDGRDDTGDLPCPVAASLPGAFLVDSRFPLDLPPDLPLVEDPPAAWAVLRRTTGGVFLPDAAPRALPDAFRALAGAWLVGCTPRMEVPR